MRRLEELYCMSRWHREEVDSVTVAINSSVAKSGKHAESYRLLAMDMSFVQFSFRWETMQAASRVFATFCRGIGEQKHTPSAKPQVPRRKRGWCLRTHSALAVVRHLYS